jgi:ParB family transcriptional regulator, chromosome partitioning protein
MTQATKTKPRLGRGLSSLISISSLPVEAEITPQHAGDHAIHTSLAAAPMPANGEPMSIPIGLIHPNPHQPRKTINDGSIAELAASVKSSGIIQPLVLRRTKDGFELIAGERRLRAAKLAGLAEVPAVVRDVDGFTQAQMALVENIQREDLNPIERAQGYRVLIDQLGLTQIELASRMGEDRSSIANYLRLLDLSEGVRTLIRDGSLSLGHAKLLAGVSNPSEQQRLADIVVAQGLSVRNLERLLQTANQPATVRKSASSPAHIQDLEKSLARQLGMRVDVRSVAKGKGRLILHYASLDQFDDLLQKLGVTPE